MNAPSFPIRLVKPGAADSSLAARLRKEIEGEVMFDAASRGRYSTDASIYQVEPLGVRWRQARRGLAVTGNVDPREVATPREDEHAARVVSLGLAGFASGHDLLDETRPFPDTDHLGRYVLSGRDGG